MIAEGSGIYTSKLAVEDPGAVTVTAFLMEIGIIDSHYSIYSNNTDLGYQNNTVIDFIKLANEPWIVRFNT